MDVWRASGGRALAEERLDRLAEDRLGDGADVLPADHAPPVDHERLGHPVDPVVDRDLPGGIGRVREGEAEALDELQRGRLLVLDRDAEHHHAQRLSPPPAGLEDRRLLVARRVAPGRPEVQDDDLAAMALQADSLAVERRQREGGGRAADQGRGDGAGVRTEAVGEEAHDGERGQRDEPARPEPHRGVAARAVGAERPEELLVARRRLPPAPGTPRSASP